MDAGNSSVFDKNPRKGRRDPRIFKILEPLLVVVRNRAFTVYGLRKTRFTQQNILKELPIGFKTRPGRVARRLDQD